MVAFMPSKPRIPGPITKALGSVIGEEIKRHGLNQKILAERCGIPGATLSQMVTGTRAIDMEQLAKAAKGLDTQSSTLLKMAERKLLDEPAVS